MNEIIIERKKFNVVILGESHLIDFPKRKHIGIINDLAAGKNIGRIFDLLEQLGLKKEAADELDTIDALSILSKMMEVASDKKKE